MFSFFAENVWAAWLCIGLFFLLLEISTVALVSVWFVPAAIIACLISLFWDNIIGQIIVFIILSVVFLVVFRKIYIKKLKEREDTLSPNASIIGRTAKAVTDITPENGKVLLGDVYWRAVSNEFIEVESSVTVKEVRATTLTVAKK